MLVNEVMPHERYFADNWLICMKLTDTCSYPAPLGATLPEYRLVLIYVYHVPDISVVIPFTQTTVSGSGYLPLMITVGIGEVISCGIIGMPVYCAAKKL